jgi:hypothetical protein
MNIEEALLILDTALEQRVLNDVQELVFRQSWLGQTYVEMAESSGYNANYIKDIGYKLWKLLSKVFKEEVTKSNFRSVIRRGYITFKNNLQPSKGEASLTRSVSEESPSIHPENSVYVPISSSVSQTQSVSTKALDSGKEIGSPKDIAFENQVGSQQILGVSTVLTAYSTAENININSQNIKTDLLTTIPQFSRPETTTKITQGLGEVVDVLAFYGCTEKLNLLKQWIMDGHCRLVTVLGEGSD